MGAKAFISYSHDDRAEAARLKECLTDCGISAFLAHEDIAVSEQWRHRILAELRDAGIFIAVLSDAFKRSEWAPQETGIAVGKRDLLIIPVSIDATIPFGFIESIQGKRLTPDADPYDLLVEPISARFPHWIIPGLTERLARARSFRDAEARMLPLVLLFAQFSKSEVSRFVEVSIANGQIWDAAACKREYLPAFLRMHRSKIRKSKRKQLQQLIGWAK